MKKTAYIDNNIVVDIEDGILSTMDLQNNVDKYITDFFYSAAHLQEATEMTAETKSGLKSRLEKRFATISSITNNNYLYTELPTHRVIFMKEKPSIVYDTINFSSMGVAAMKGIMNILSETKKQELRDQLGIEPKRINNYNPSEIIEHINSKSDLMGGYSFLDILDKAIELHPQGAEMGIGNRFGGIFEFLDLVGYWKDKFNEKSNYARLWDSNHAYYSSYCDYFISNDRRTRNKARVAFEIYGLKTKIVSSVGAE